MDYDFNTKQSGPDPCCLLRGDRNHPQYTLPDTQNSDSSLQMDAKQQPLILKFNKPYNSVHKGLLWTIYLWKLLSTRFLKWYGSSSVPTIKRGLRRPVYGDRNHSANSWLKTILVFLISVCDKTCEYIVENHCKSDVIGHIADVNVSVEKCLCF